VNLLLDIIYKNTSFKHVDELECKVKLVVSKVCKIPRKFTYENAFRFHAVKSNRACFKHACFSCNFNISRVSQRTVIQRRFKIHCTHFFVRFTDSISHIHSHIHCPVLCHFNLNRKEFNSSSVTFSLYLIQNCQNARIHTHTHTHTHTHSHSPPGRRTQGSSGDRSTRF